MDPSPYIQACKLDCCDQNSNMCACETMEAYSRACMDQGLVMIWRKPDRCGKYLVKELETLSVVIAYKSWVCETWIINEQINKSQKQNKCISREEAICVVISQKSKVSSEKLQKIVNYYTMRKNNQNSLDEQLKIFIINEKFNWGKKKKKEGRVDWGKKACHLTWKKTTLIAVAKNYTIQWNITVNAFEIEHSDSDKMMRCLYCFIYTNLYYCYTILLL